MKVSQERGYILHSYHYRESSLIVELFARHFGRVSVLAKGARRWKKRGSNTYLRPFQEFSFSWVGKGELVTLTGAEELKPSSSLNKSAIYCGFYMNELLMRLLHRHDPHEQLYDYYDASMNGFINSEPAEPILRVFEKRLLGETGYGLNLDTDIDSGEPVEADKNYYYLLNRGPTSVKSQVDGAGKIEISGRSLIALQDENIDELSVLRELKQFMRRVIDHQLNYRPLSSRDIFNRTSAGK